ncbi:Ca2+-transporting ATPase [Paraburkholderia youngii]|uniref:cation-translocating P-type ATPase n=1 Tax=Paraburkholderia youngii TaxID=2782701 RepID=UPI003D1A6DB0
MNARFSTALALDLPYANRAATESVNVLHARLPGRVRAHVPWLYRDPKACAAFVKRLAATRGMLDVDANPWTGNVLLVFDKDVPLARAIRCIETSGASDDAYTTATTSRSDASVLHADFSKHGRSEQRRPIPRVLSATARPFEAAPQAWHALSVKQVLFAVGSSKLRGLSEHAARRRRLIHGPNRLQPPPRRSALAMFMSQFKSLPVLLLAGSAAASVATGGLADAVVILGVVLINATIGYVTESRTERAIEALSDSTPREALVVRSGVMQRMAAAELVVGDILVLANGAYVAADARVIQAHDLRTDESALTGESMPVLKSAQRMDRTDIALADRACMVHMGSAVVGGSGLAVVVSVGAATEYGVIQSLVGSTRPPATPMQQQLERLGNLTVRLGGAVCALVFVLGLVRGLGVMAMFRASVSLAVAAVPEGLPTVAMTTLALGIRRMRNHKVLVRRLDAVETLGAVHTVCFDKTGTLTFNRMRVLAAQIDDERWSVVDGLVYSSRQRINPFEHDGLLRLLHVAALCNEVEISGKGRQYRLNGSSTENALMEFVLSSGIDAEALRERHPLVSVAHRADERNYMCTLHGDARDDDRLIAVKGNPVEVMTLCSERLWNGEHVPMTEADRQAILQRNVEMGGDALRVLGFAYATGSGALGLETQNLCWLGMLGLADPVRDGARELIALLREAGIKTVMITGDQRETARAIGRSLDIGADALPRVVELTADDRTESPALTQLAGSADIFARVSASDKLRIIRGLQNEGEVVAMVGDGINDGPALKAANISIAMGRHTTDLAREIADVVLEDDNIQTLTVAIGQGRTIYNNIRKSVHFLVSTNVSEIVVTLAAVGAGLGQPLTPMQLLWINLLSDVFPALALAVEPQEPDVLRTPPRSIGEPIISRADMMRYGREALTISAGALASHALAAARHGPGAGAATVSFMTLTLGQLLHAYGCRSDSRGPLNIFRRPRNRYLDLAIGGSMALQVVAGAVPGLGKLLSISRIDMLDALAVALGASAPYIVNEAMKPPAREENATRTSVTSHLPVPR